MLPDTLVCAHCRRELPPELLRAVKENFPHARVVEPDESWLSREEVPENVLQAAEQGHWRYVEEYLSLLCLWEEGALPFPKRPFPAFCSNAAGWRRPFSALRTRRT